MDIFAKIFNGWKPLTIFTKMSILDGWQDSDYTNALRAKMKVATLKFRSLQEPKSVNLMFYKKRWVPYSETFLCYDLPSETNYKCVISILPTLYGACITLIWSRKEVVAIAYKKGVFTSTWTPLPQSAEGSQVIFQIKFCKT